MTEQERSKWRVALAWLSDVDHAPRRCVAMAYETCPKYHGRDEFASLLEDALLRAAGSNPSRQDVLGLRQQVLELLWEEGA